MSLISFHRFLIAAAIAFCLGFGAWEFSRAVDGTGLGGFVLGSVFMVLGVGLVVYLRHLGRFLGYEEGPGG